MLLDCVAGVVAVEVITSPVVESLAAKANPSPATQYRFRSRRRQSLRLQRECLEPNERRRRMHVVQMERAKTTAKQNAIISLQKIHNPIDWGKVP